MNNELTLSGTIIFPASGYLQGKIEWTAVGDPQNNRAIVTTNLYAHRTNNASTTGRSWTGKVKVGDNTTHNFTGFSTERTISSSYVLFATYTDIVDYEGSADKTITISGQVKGPSGTSLANNTSSGSASVVLPTLHKSPEVIISSVQELNTSLGITDDTFVQYLSEKRFTLQGVAYDDATILGYSIANGNRVASLDQNVIDFDFIGNSLYIEANVVPIKASVSDSYNSIGTITQNYSNYILYQLPTIEPTSTTTKRNGQTSGKCLLNVVGNYWVGEIGGVTNAPVVKYRFWEKGTTEPSTWETVPSANVSTNNGRVTVTDYEIGSNNPNDSNYFDYQKAYTIRVAIFDNYRMDYTVKGITVGEAVWSEYKDRVDFIRATIKGKDVLTTDNYFKVIWENPSLTSFSAQQITLDESINNFSYYEIIYKINDTQDFYISSGKTPVGLNNSTVSQDGFKFVYRYINSMSGTSFEFNDCRQASSYGANTIVKNDSLIPYLILGYK